MTQHWRNRREGPGGNGLLTIVAILGIVAILAVGCGLGDIPTRPPRSDAAQAPGPTALPSSSLSPSPTAASSPTATASPTEKPSPTPVVYTVKAGDSLLSIAKRYNTTARSIAFWNRAKYKRLDPTSPSYDPNNIEIGWRLTIIPGLKLDDNGAAPSAAPSG